MKPRFAVAVVLVGEFESEQEARETDFRQLAALTCQRVLAMTTQARNPDVAAVACRAEYIEPQMETMGRMARDLVGVDQAKE